MELVRGKNSQFKNYLTYLSNCLARKVSMRTKISLFIILCLFYYPSYSFNKNSLPNDATTTLNSIYEKDKAITKGKQASYIPELAKVDPELFAISIVTVDGKSLSVGDADTLFSLQSISKIFAYALALADNGEEIIFNNIGLEATGEPFNSIRSLEQNTPHNPFVNVGAIQTTSYIKGDDSTQKWNRLLSFIGSLSDGKPFLSQKIYASESQTNRRNHAIAQLLKSRDMLIGEPDEVLDRYTKACSIMVNTKQLALMGATLANYGVNPITKQQVIAPEFVRAVLSEMVINGIYEKSGSWFVTIGIPSKSGVSGGIIAIVPNKMAIAVYSPRLDKAGTSVRGQAVLKALSRKWKLHVLDQHL